MVQVVPAGRPEARDEYPPGGRSARKRQAIIEAATALFLEQGYQGTSMDDIAATAAVSKQTVYKNFADKQQLFSDIVLGAALPRMLAGTDDLEAALKALARRYLATVMQPRLLQMRRLIVAESGRFPDLARAYYERVPEHVMTGLAAQFGDLAGRGLLRIDDPAVAAGHYAFLVLGLALDRAMFLGPGHGMSAAELDRQADEAARAFLAAYGPP